MRHGVAVVLALAALMGGGGAAFAAPSPPPLPASPTQDAPAQAPTPAPTQEPTQAPTQEPGSPGVTDLLRQNPVYGGALEQGVEVLCMRPPTPDRPSAGVAGTIDRGPGTQTTTTMYEQSGYAGFQLPIYDPGCAPGLQTAQKRIFDGPNVIAEFMIGMSLAGVALIAFATRFVTDPGGVWQALTDASGVAQATIGVAVFTGFAFLAVIAGGIIMAYRQRRKSDVPYTTRKTAGMAAIMTIGAMVLIHHFTVAALYDEAVSEGFTAMSATVSTATSNTDRADVAAANVALDRIVYPQWAKALLGDNPEAIEAYGRELHTASGFSRAEAAVISRDPSAEATLVAAKQAAFRETAGKLRAEYPAAYEHLSGTRTTPRVGPAFLMLSTIVIVFAPTMLGLVGMGLSRLGMRVAVAVLPVGAVVWILPEQQSNMRRFLHVVWLLVKIAAGGIVLWAFTMVLVVGAVIDSDADFFAKVAVSFLFVLLLWAGWKYRGKYRDRFVSSQRDQQAVKDIKQAAQVTSRVMEPVTRRLVTVRDRTVGSPKKGADDSAVGKRWQKRQKSRTANPVGVAGSVSAVRADRARKIRKEQAAAEATVPAPAAAPPKRRMLRKSRTVRRSGAADQWTPGAGTNPGTAGVKPARAATPRKVTASKVVNMSAPSTPVKGAAVPVLVRSGK